MDWNSASGLFRLPQHGSSKPRWISITNNAFRGMFKLPSLTAVGLVGIIFSRGTGCHEQGGGFGFETTKISVITRQNGGGIDAIDERLIALLMRDARMTLTALAQSVSLSRTAVQARIARLERDKIIVGYQAVVRESHRDEALGAILSIVFSQRPCRPVVAKFRHWPEIVHYYSVTGPVDAYVVVRVRNSQLLAELVDRFSAIPGIASASSAVMLRADQWE